MPGTGVTHVEALVVKGEAVDIPIDCAAGGASCRVTTTITVIKTLHPHGELIHRTIVIGTARTTVAAGAGRTFKVMISPAGRKLVAAHRSLKTTVTVTSGSGRPASTVADRRAMLTAAKRHHKK
jgi:hypothetical protein